MSIPAITYTGTFEDARRYTRKHARSFYFASHVLPKKKRLAAYAVYAFCRLADNTVDRGDHPDVATQLQDLRRQLDHVYAESPAMKPGFNAFRETVIRNDIPKQYFLDLLRGLEMDLTVTRFNTFGDLDEYCYCVASVVGLIMSRVFGVEDRRADRFAKNLGTGMQLTNILRDIREDFERGRIYLPQDELKQFGITPDVFAQGAVTENFVNLMRFQITRARRYYQSSHEGLAYIPDDGSRFCVQLMSGTYGAILDRIEHNNYDVFSRRAIVPPWKKGMIAVTAFRKKQVEPQPGKSRTTVEAFDWGG